MDNHGNTIFSFMFDDDSDDEEHHQRVIKVIVHHTSQENEATKHGGSIVGCVYKNREREDHHRNLMSDYFIERPHFNTTYFPIGSNNDINILACSLLFNDVVHGVALHVEYIVNGNQYHLGYYLADGIYPRPARMWCKDNLHSIMMTCIILHNMIVEDEYEYVEVESDDEDMCQQRSKRARARQYELEPSITYEYH
ncbi:unnamed protein product [Prunus brigantina]